ncbi:protein of unknown function [Flaviramulus basaltis]|uniref:Fibronectin type-III domain-containing protein n=1 Tax=Flaviramulus basaltis TaxID=369401 RepID=A0A1K2IK12_9FLAO|nr:DUF5123 domain-containing protein [Flaviramulus basaltis]SFZ92727.1 protein of unknown function [Flaviramulus basaltis]
MKTKYILKAFFTLFITFTIVSCGYDTDVIEELSIDREFAPVALSARVRNQTTVELNWTTEDYIEYYVVEFSADDPNFTNIFQTEQVTASQLPIQIRLEGETLYSIRIKAISARGLNESKWAILEAETLTEQIIIPSEPGDIQALQATLRWEAGLNVTHFILQPGDIRYDITDQEKAAGIATITDLISETNYTATLYNNTKIRGIANFTTGIDIGDNTLVLPTDDLFQMIADAAPGDILLLEQGDYTAQTGTVTLDKSITIQGLRVDFKPLLSINFELNDGTTDLSLIDLDLDGATTITDVVTYSGVGNYNSLLISGCNVHDFARSFIRGNTTDAVLQTLTIENSIVSNILTDGGDFIDFRNSDVLNVNINTSTFNNCAPGRDFLRLDDAGTSTQNGLTCNVLLDSCTIYACSDSSSKRILYVRFQENKITVQNTLITDTTSEGYSDQSRTDPNPTFINNNYFNAAGFSNTAQTVYDGSGTFTELDPGYIDAASGNFTITNQTLLDNAVGDPRWRP